MTVVLERPKPKTTFFKPFLTKTSVIPITAHCLKCFDFQTVEGIVVDGRLKSIVATRKFFKYQSKYYHICGGEVKLFLPVSLQMLKAKSKLNS